MEANTKFLIFDTETTGLFGDTLNPETPDYYPQIIQISWVFFGLGEQNIQIKSFYINPSKRINSGASAVHVKLSVVEMGMLFIRNLQFLFVI